MRVFLAAPAGTEFDPWVTARFLAALDGMDATRAMTSQLVAGLFPVQLAAFAGEVAYLAQSVVGSVPFSWILDAKSPQRVV